MARKLRIRANPTGSFFGGIICLVFVGIGLCVVIPAAGAFGVFWTVLALAGTITSFYNAFSERGIASEIIEVDEDGIDAPARSVESRLRKLNDLRAKGLVTEAEHQRRREEILREL
jgi:hypothetical protein